MRTQTLHALHDTAEARRETRQCRELSLRDAVPTGGPETGGFAARMGGEEFLLVLVGLTAADVVDRVEALRVDLAGAPWAPLTGDLPVTASFGVAHARPGQPAPEDPSTLLSRADGALYEATHAGRDRVRVAIAVAVSPRANG